MAVAYLAVFHVCFVMFAWTYWKSIFTPPSQPSKQFHMSYSDKERYENEERSEVQKQILLDIAKRLPVYTWAASGATVTLTGSGSMLILLYFYFNCRVNNCIGFSNYKFFLLFLTYAMVYCVFIASTVLQYFIKFWAGELPNGHAKFHILFLLFVALMFFVSLMFLFGYHCWLVAKNRSTLGKETQTGFFFFFFCNIWMLLAIQKPVPKNGLMFSLQGRTQIALSCDCGIGL
ncbi:Palmitoyltransferase ZDHHC15 [Acipenser ruthenus]|uniref:Palmitoyltransferase n=1 Tax=Acipenser ruthenus TaxID=7906 RepID=A0A444V7P4_ACIRT|nr:Palmitoyltransferase ZDHHC15 [Acipenser ruthenus]